MSIWMESPIRQMQNTTLGYVGVDILAFKVRQTHLYYDRIVWRFVSEWFDRQSHWYVSCCWLTMLEDDLFSWSCPFIDKCYHTSRRFNRYKIPLVHFLRRQFWCSWMFEFSIVLTLRQPCPVGSWHRDLVTFVTPRSFMTFSVLWVP